MQKISALVHTFNSEKYLNECLASLSWVDEIIVIDMGSTDSTLKIAQSRGAAVYQVEHKGYADPARQFGLSKATQPWVIALDSDEVMPKALQEKLIEIANSDAADVVYLCFRNFFFGRELKGTGWSFQDIRVPRFFKNGFLSYNDKVHAFHEIRKDSRIKYLVQKNMAVIHFNYDSISHFIQKLDRYTNYEAAKLANAPRLMKSVIYQFIREFFGRFLLKKGYSDGWIGFYLSFAMAFYRMTSIMKFDLPKESEVVVKYKNIAQRILKGEDCD